MTGFTVFCLFMMMPHVQSKKIGLVRTFPCLPGLNEDKVYCSRTQCSASSEPST